MEPTGPDCLRSQLANPLAQFSIRTDKDDVHRGGRRLLDQGVVAVTGGVHDPYAVNLALGHPGAGGAFEDHHCRQREPSPSRRLTQILD